MLINKVYNAFVWRYRYYVAYLIRFIAIILEYLIVKGYKIYWFKKADYYKKQRKKRLKPRLFWGPVPILNNKYWSIAMREIGFDSFTVMETVYTDINEKGDYDIYCGDIKFDNFFEKILLKFEKICPVIRDLLITNFILRNYDILHIPCTGVALSKTKYRFMEAALFKAFGIKTIVMFYGADGFQYSKVIDLSLRHGLLRAYPQAAINEEFIESNVKYWVKYADLFLPSALVEGVGRWDLLTYNVICIDTNLWKSKTLFSQSDGINDVVNIIHTPNHRGSKGTEFIIDAVDQLKSEGLKVNLILLEKVQNSEVRRIMLEEADILAEQVIFPGYALSGIEAMASGLPVLTNLDYEEYQKLFRRFSYLRESPVFATTPETIKEDLRLLVRNPKLREELGRAGRKYVEKYHSYQTAQYMFGKIYDKIWYEKEVDLMNMFHPLNPESYNNQSPKVEHPLVENKIPASLLSTLNT